MPQNKFAIARYRLIDSLLRKKNYVSSREIAAHCLNITGFSVSVRTIQMDIHTMKNDPFIGMFAPIEYCTRRKAFYYDSFITKYSFTDSFSAELDKIENILNLCGQYIPKEHIDEFEASAKNIKSLFKNIS